MASETLTEYERRRLENIKRNDEMMASLMIHRNAADLSSSLKRSKPPKTTPGTKKIKAEPGAPVVVRRSLRTRGISPDPSRLPSDPPNHPSSPPPLPVSRQAHFRMQDAYIGSPLSERHLVSTISGMSDNKPLDPMKKCAANGSVSSAWEPRATMVLREENVKRLLPGRILNVRFFPVENRTIIAAGDKLGHVGFWDFDFRGGKGDGAYVYSPHSAPVSGISIQSFALSKIFTSSYDGFIRLMDVDAETFNMVYSGVYAIFSISHRHHDVKTFYFGEGPGELKVWDERAGKVSSSWVLHDDRINSIDFDPGNTNLMATSSTDGTACIWDLRSVNADKLKRLQIVQHGRAVHSAYFSPSGSSLATTSLDNRVGILSGANFSDTTMVSHNNKTGRWISSFRAIWGWDDSYLFLGNMKRAVDVISIGDKTTVALESPYISAIPCRFAAHPYKHGFLAGATAGGKVYLWTA